MKPILCIDPGASGGLALLNREGIVEAFPMRDGMTGQIDAIRHIAATVGAMIAETWANKSNPTGQPRAVSARSVAPGCSTLNSGGSNANL